MAWMRLHEAAEKIPDLLIQGKVSFNFDGIPLRAKNLSLKRKMNLLRAGLDGILKSNRLQGLPPIIQIEPTNICNLKCPLCPSGSGSLARPKGFMSMDTFHRILDEVEEVLIAMYLFCFGEPFMHKKLHQMIRECSTRNILTLTSTNGHYVQTLDDALKIVDTQLTVLIIALDGSTQEIYGTYRRGGDIEKVKNCISLIERAKTLRHSSLPYTAVRSVVTHDNENDLANIERLAEELGVNMFTCKSLGCMTHSNDFKEYEPLKRDVRRFEYAGASRISKRLVKCPFAFRQPIVFWDGTVVGCEYDHLTEKAFGKVGEQPFHKIWNSNNAIELRRSIRERRNRPKFCTNCPYQDRVQKGTYLMCKELRPLVS
jgi:radical SAM protein with 4Fe4S-binding SPASM domain